MCWEGEMHPESKVDVINYWDGGGLVVPWPEAMVAFNAEQIKPQSHPTEQQLAVCMLKQ